MVNFIKRKFRITAFTSLIVGLKYGTFLFVITKHEISQISPLNSLSTLVAFWMSSVILKEEVERRWIAAIFMVAGAIILAYNL